MALDIEGMKRWMKDNIKEIQSIRDVAKRWNSSPETIRKEFWRKEKRALGDFLIDVRIETAKKLLIETDLLCKEVCYESGFHREDTGAETFKQRVGETIAQFRARHRQQKTMQERENSGETDRRDKPPGQTLEPNGILLRITKTGHNLNSKRRWPQREDTPGKVFKMLCGTCADSWPANGLRFDVSPSDQQCRAELFGKDDRAFSGSEG